MNNYEVYFHVNDNAKTYAHNDSMLVEAESPSDVMQEFKRRIDEEFDFDFLDIDFGSLEVYDADTNSAYCQCFLDNIVNNIEKHFEQENSRKNDCMERD